MTFQEKLAIFAAIAAVLALPVLARPSTAREPAIPRSESATALWLLVVAGALIAVGIVSASLLRHVVQVAPLVLAAGIAAVRPRWAACIAAPLFAHWLIVMIAIWLFLLGVARIVTGAFTPAEIALSILIGTSAVLGLAASYQRRREVPSFRGTCAIAAFAALQFAAMWLSTQPFIAT